MELIELLKELQNMVEEAPNKPFSSKISLDRDEVLNLIRDIMSVVPEEVKQASWVNTERVKIMNDAQVEAEEIIIKAQKKAEEILEERQKYIQELDLQYKEQIEAMVESHEIVKKAHERAEEVKEKAEKYKYEMIAGSNQYADDVLTFLEQKIEETLEQVRSNKSELNPRA